MKPENIFNEWVAGVARAVGLVLILILSAILAGKITRWFGLTNLLAYLLIFFALAGGITLLFDLLRESRRSRRKPLKRVGYD